MGVVHKVKRAAAAAESQMNSIAPPPVSASSASPISKYPRFGKRGAPQAFPSKLYEILEGENPDIVGWTATGRGFEVRDHARLSSEVLGRFFKQDKFSSFQRQLNLYGFRKITKGSEAGSYQHPHFRRGERTTLLTIRRSTKPSPARIVPNSPASRATAPTVPLASSSSAISTPSSSSSSAVPVSSGGDANKKPRSATPSPPPAPVRGILPWPRPPAGGAPVLSEPARRVSPNDSSVESGGPVTSPSGGSFGGAPPLADRHTGEHQKQQPDNRGGDAGVWGGVQRGGGSYVDYMGAAPAPGNVQIEWKGDSRPRREAPMGTAAATAANTSTGGMHSAKSQSWGEEVAKKGNERTQGLDHQDVEVVGLLQRMAKEAQDSPSRQRSAAATGSTSVSASTPASASMTTSRWEGRGSSAQAGPPPVDAPQPHSQYKMSRSPTRSGGTQHGQQMVSSERLHDIPNHERMEDPPRRPFPYAFGGDGRAVGVHHPSHQRLPAPFPSVSSVSEGYHEPLRRGDMPASDRDDSTVHGRRQQERGSAFEVNAHLSTGRGGRPVFRYNYDVGVEVDGYRRGGPEHWQGSVGPYPGPAVPLSYRKYRGEDNGKFGGGVGAPVGSEDSWAQHRQYQGGR